MENYNIVGNNGERRVFKIPVGNLTIEEAEKYIKDLMDKYKEEMPTDLILPEVNIPWYKKIFR